jgi:hypothetical protein
VLGDRAKAIANWEIALENIPDNQKPNRAVHERALQALKDGK